MTVAGQLPLGLGQIRPTIAMRRDGREWIEQCGDCGLLAAVTDLATTKKLGPCPACGCEHWSRQPLPVGPFTPVDDDDEAAG